MLKVSAGKSLANTRVLFPKPLLIKTAKVGTGVKGQIVQPICNRSSQPAPCILPPPLQDAESVFTPGLTLIPNVEHRPVEQVSVSSFLVLIHNCDPQCSPFISIKSFVEPKSQSLLRPESLPNHRRSLLRARQILQARPRLLVQRLPIVLVQPQWIKPIPVVQA